MHAKQMQRCLNGFVVVLLPNHSKEWEFPTSQHENSPSWPRMAVRYDTLVRYGTSQFLLRSTVRWYGTPFL